MFTQPLPLALALGNGKEKGRAGCESDASPISIMHSQLLHTLDLLWTSLLQALVVASITLSYAARSVNYGTADGSLMSWWVSVAEPESDTSDTYIRSHTAPAVLLD